MVSLRLIISLRDAHLQSILARMVLPHCHIHFRGSEVLGLLWAACGVNLCRRTTSKRIRDFAQNSNRTIASIQLPSLASTLHCERNVKKATLHVWHCQRCSLPCQRSLNRSLVNLVGFLSPAQTCRSFGYRSDSPLLPFIVTHSNSHSEPFANYSLHGHVCI